MKAPFKILALGALFAAAAMANLLTNGTFSGGSGNQNLTPGSTAIPGWTTSVGYVSWQESGSFGVSAQDASAFYVDLTGLTDVQPWGAISQTVFLAAGNYSMTFYLGEYQGNAVDCGPVSVLVSAGNRSSVPFTTTVPVGSTSTVWQQQALNFTVETAGNVTITILGNSTACGHFIGLDNVDLEVASVPATPAPSTLSLLALAVLILGAAQLLRSRRAKGTA
jgi:Protein of unknown function (DUF642)